MHKRKSIWATQEYALASPEKQGWAFTHNGHYANAIEAAEKAGVKVKGRTVKVKANDGQEHDVEVDADLYDIKPARKYPTVLSRRDGEKPVKYWMLQGTSPRGKKSVYITLSDFRSSDDLKKFKEEIETGVERYFNTHHEMLKKELAKTHAPLAKKAAEELKTAADDGVEGIAKWFKVHGFNLSNFKTEWFKPLLKRIKDGHGITTQWEVNSRPDGHGHQAGANAVVDWNDKKISTYGWSSDD